MIKLVVSQRLQPAHLQAELTAPVRCVGRELWRGRRQRAATRDVAEETPVAFTYNGTTHAVMMATPSDLEDFAIGFSLTEGIVGEIDQIECLDMLSIDQGIELRMRIEPGAHRSFQRRRRHLAGPTGCGLCGVESIDDALRPVRQVKGQVSLDPHWIERLVNQLSAKQAFHHRTHAMHAAGFARPGEDMIVREDVGRHNALDKLAGAIAHNNIVGETGVIVLSSRVSIEMVQKAAAIGATAIVAVSAPTARAIRACASAGITLVAIARHDGFEVFTHAGRLFPHGS